MDKRINILAIIIGGLFLLLSPATLQAKTYPYTPEKGVIIPGLFEGPKAGKETSHIFQNVAKLGAASSRHPFYQASVEGTQDFFGYNTTQIGVVLPFELFTIGVGYLTQQAGDNTRTAFSDSASHGVAVLDQFNDTNNQVVVGVGTYVSPELRIGSVVRNYYHALDNDSVSSLSLDGAITWDPLGYLSLGVTSHNLFQTSRQWHKSNIAETLRTYADVEATLHSAKGYVTAKTDLQYLRTSGEWRLHPNLGVLGDVVFDDGSTKRYSYGIGLYMGLINIQYLHITFPETVLNFNQDIFGFHIAYDFSNT